MNVIIRKIKDISIMLFPIIIISLLLQLSLFLYDKENVDMDILYRFLFSSFIMFIAIFFLLVGLDFSIINFGEELGASLLKKRFYFVIPIVSLIGVLITISEPDLYIVANQVYLLSQNKLSLYLLILTISISVGIFLLVSIIRLIFNLNIKYTLIILYIIAFLLQTILTSLNDKLVSVSYDIGAATTGIIIVPFILSLGIGLGRNKTKKSLSDSFGIVGIVSVGALIGVIIYFIIKSKTNLTIKQDNSVSYESWFSPFLKQSPLYLLQTLISIGPFLIMFLILNFTTLKLKKYRIKKIIKGFIYIFIGLYLFLLASNIGFTDFAYFLGKSIKNYSDYLKIFLALLIGLAVIIAEPSSKVLAEEIYKASSGAIKKRTIILFLSFSVGIAMLLISLRSILKLNLVYIIMPLYLIALILLVFTNEIFEGLSFDAGSVASGPLTSIYILSFMQGIETNTDYELLYGCIAIVSVFPIIFILSLGVFHNIKQKKKGAIKNV